MMPLDDHYITHSLNYRLLFPSEQPINNTINNNHNNNNHNNNIIHRSSPNRLHTSEDGLEFDDSLMDSDNNTNNTPNTNKQFTFHCIPTSKNHFLQIYRHYKYNKRLKLCFLMLLLTILLIITLKLLLQLAKAGYFDPSVVNKTMVIYSQQNSYFGLSYTQGMFSEFQSVLGAIIYGIQNNAAAVKIIFDNPMYLSVNNTEKNYWSEYFTESTLILNPAQYEPSTTEQVHFNGYLSRFGQLGSFSPILTGKRLNTQPYPMEPLLYSRTHTNQLIQRYIHIKPHLLDQINEFESKYFNPKQFKVGIHYRGTDKKADQKDQNPDFIVFAHYVAELKRYYRFNEFQIFIATDEQLFLDWAAETWGKNNIIYYSNSPRLTTKQSNKVEQII